MSIKVSIWKRFDQCKFITDFQTSYHLLKCFPCYKNNQITSHITALGLSYVYSLKFFAKCNMKLCCLRVPDYSTVLIFMLGNWNRVHPIFHTLLPLGIVSCPLLFPYPSISLFTSSPFSFSFLPRPGWVPTQHLPLLPPLCFCNILCIPLTTWY